MRRVFTFALLMLASPAMAQTQPAAPTAGQAAVEQRGAAVMPFDQARTMHMFQAAPTGGTMMIMSTDGDATQIGLVRSHLAREAAAFAHGDYADPIAIHGPDMPGLAALQAKAPLIRITYREMPQGAEIVFATDDAAALTALHSWFAAQAKDHGMHAMMMK